MMNLTPNYFHYNRNIYSIFTDNYITWSSYILRSFSNRPAFRFLS